MARIGRAFPSHIISRRAKMRSINYSSSFSDTVTVTDTFSALSVSILDLLDTIGISDTTISRAITRTIVEVVTVTETFRKATTRLLSDASITLSDIMQKAMGKNPSETITVSDTLGRSTGFNRTFSEIVTLSEVFAKAYGRYRTLSETVTLSEVITFINGKVLSDIITVTDAFNRLKNGVLLGWTKLAKAVATWTKTALSTAIWTKVAEPTSTWTKTEKPRD